MKARTPSLPQPNPDWGLLWRPLSLEDGPAVQALNRANQETDQLDSVQPLAEINEMLQFLAQNLEADTVAAFDKNETLVAMGMFFIPPKEDEYLFQGSGDVHHRYRGRGIARFLVSWLEARARQKLAELPPGKPGAMMTGVRETMSDRIRLLQEHGFTPVRYFNKMQRDLSQPIPDKSLPDDLQLVTISPELQEGARAAFNDSFRDHFNFFPVDAEIWERFFIGKPSFRPDLSTLALRVAGEDAGKVVGFCLCAVDAERNAQSGENEGIMDEIGVIRGWRKRGIATALIVESMRRMRAAGVAFAALGVDTDSPTGALGLYENLGFTAVRRSISLRKELN